VNRSTHVPFLRFSGVVLGLALCALAGGARAESVPAVPRDVTQIDIDELMQVRVSIASKKPEPFARIPAAVYVIQGEDLERSGVYTLAEALRMVPGFHVARQRANAWSVSSRGFNGGNSNKLLVLIDGRSVYSNLQSGVFWDVQDMLLDDVDRIEVVRGPGGTLWGTNAMNGVINVISKPADHSPGLGLTTAVGRELRSLAGGRYGFALDEQHHVRVSGKLIALDESARGSDPRHQMHDGLLVRRADVRSDWADGDTSLGIKAGFYDGGSELPHVELQFTPPFQSIHNDRADVTGGHLIGHWAHELAADSSLDVQAYYDYAGRRNENFEDRVHTGDLELEYRLQPRPRHDVVVGAGYRLVLTDLQETDLVKLANARRTDNLWSAFAQDQITLAEQRLWLTLGLRVEHNDYSGFELLPNARLALAVDERSTAWLAASRAVRAPSLLDVDIRVDTQVVRPNALPLLIRSVGTEHFRPEVLYAFETGYRTQPTADLSLDFAVFANFYDDLRAFSRGTPFFETNTPPFYAVVPFYIVNETRARSFGGEIAADVQLAPWWRLRASYTHLSLNTHKTKRLDDDTARSDDQDEGLAPRNQLWLRSSLALPFKLSLDVMGRYVGRLHHTRARRYVEADVRLAWLSGAGMEVALVGRNLLHREHAEYAGSSIERDVFLQLTWRP